MASFSKNSSLAEFQEFINTIYSVPDDRLFSVSDLISNQERFTMRALKGIRKNDMKKVKLNLLIALSWLMAIANRFHISLDDSVWKRFPMFCSYCGSKPCICKKIKPAKRAKIQRNNDLKPQTLSDFQQMFSEIYPPTARTLDEAGVHLAEEVGELSEAVHFFLGEHSKIVFQNVIEEMADYVSCVFGVANSAKINLAKELADMYHFNCHVCHKSPCTCSFSFVSRIKS
jgi:NTP pyrophosphatase (non-canonical NTP hydrolase)